MSGAEVVRYERTGDPGVDRAVRYWGQASLLPKQYRLPDDKGGGVDWPNLTIAALTLRALGVEQVQPNIPATYVVGGAVGLMAALQVALAQNYDVWPTIEASDAKFARARLLHGGTWSCPWCARAGYEGHEATVTIAEATSAGWAKRNPNYATMPRNMLESRAITELLRRNAPGVLRGLASKAANVARLDDFEVEQSAPAAPLPPPGVPQSPAPTTRRSTDELALDLADSLARLDEYDPNLAAELYAEYQSLQGELTDYAGRAFHMPRRLVVRYMLDEYRATFESSGGAERSQPDSHDAAPTGEGGADPDDSAPERTAGDDGRPF